MNTIIEEVKLGRAFACAFYDALAEGKIEAPKEVLEKFKVLKDYYDAQMSRELS